MLKEGGHSTSFAAVFLSLQVKYSTRRVCNKSKNIGDKHGYMYLVTSDRVLLQIGNLCCQKKMHNAIIVYH